MEIDRGGAALALEPPASSSRGAVTALAGGGASSSGLDVAYRRLDPQRAAGDEGPSMAARALAWAFPGVVFLATAFGLFRLAHRPGGHALARLLPHAFDATSTEQSGALAAGALIFAIAIGVVGLRVEPRSYAMLTSAGAMVIASLAMVTVTLVSTEEQPGPADGALIIPYVVPFAVLALAGGTAARGPALFLGGGARRARAIFAALAGGALAFAALEISTFAARL
jgi:hypothetical protein